VFGNRDARNDLWRTDSGVMLSETALTITCGDSFCAALLIEYLLLFVQSVKLKLAVAA
jgi:hypothetical protein